MKNKATLIIILTSIIGLLCGALFVAGGFLVYDYVIKTPGKNTTPLSSPGGNNEEYSNPFQPKHEYALFNDYKDPQEIQEDEPVIIEYGLYTKEDRSESIFFLGEEGIQLLKDRIIKHIGYGPEMFLLDSIIIGDEKIITEEANGEYSPSTNQIIINIDNFKNLLAMNAYDPNYLVTKVDMLFEIIFHEYGHHLAYVYLNSIKDKDPVNTKGIQSDSKTNPAKIFPNYGSSNEEDEEKNVSSEESWNRHFVKWFKQLLNYDKETPKSGNSKLPSYNSFAGLHHDFEHISKYLNQKDIFEIANGQSDYSNFEEWMNVQTRQTKREFLNNREFSALNYYYSLDELFTRKYQQLNQIYDSNTKNPKSYFYDNGFIVIKYPNDKYQYNKDYPSDVAFNTFWYQDTFKVLYSTSTPQSPFTKRFQFDAPFENEKFGIKDTTSGNLIKSYPIDLYNLMDAHMGHVSTFNFSENDPDNNEVFNTLPGNVKDGADISFMWRRNGSKISSVHGQKVISSLQKNQNEDDSIKFGGYINVDPNGTNPIVGVKFGDSQEMEEVFVSNYTYKHKDKLVTNERVPLANDVEKYFYVTKNWIQGSDIANQKVSFVYQNGTETPLKTVREEEFGTPSTYAPFLVLDNRKLLEDQQNSFIEFIATKNNSNEVVIQKRPNA